MNEFESYSFPVSEVEEKLGYHFQRPSLLMQAFTRSSYAAEHYDATDNEVLEFIGDSVVGMMIVKYLSDRYAHKTQSELMRQQLLRSEELDSLSEAEQIELCQERIEHAHITEDEAMEQRWREGMRKGLFDKRYQCELDEAELSLLKIELVKRETLAAATERLGLEDYLLMGKSDLQGEVQHQASVKEDLLEAIVGAAATDCSWNYDVLESLVIRLLDPEKLLEYGRPGDIDYEDWLVKWFEKNGQELRFATSKCVCRHLKHAVHLNLGARMLNFDAFGYGNTEKGARRMASKRAYDFIVKIQDRKKAIYNAVGNPNFARAVNQLQELYQKKLIPEPKYTFFQEGTSADGNPMWGCECEIEGLVNQNGSFIYKSKLEAKKSQAYEALCYLFGFDLGGWFAENSTVTETKVIENKNTET